MVHRCDISSIRTLYAPKITVVHELFLRMSRAVVSPAKSKDHLAEARLAYNDRE